jgi:hypothetical protein
MKNLLLALTIALFLFTPSVVLAERGGGREPIKTESNGGK